MTRVSIVILNWNGIGYLKQFLPTLVEFSRAKGAEVVVADNCSDDGSVEFVESAFSSVRLIKLDRNYGFTGGYNRALARIESQYYILLNSDVEVTRGWLEPMLAFMDENPDCALCSPKVLDQARRNHFEYSGAAGGYIDRLGYPFCRGRIFDHLEEDRGQYDEPADIFWGSGACLMVRSDRYHEAGGLDEQFFAHMEEIDLCWRLQRMGHRICSVPASTIYHVGGGTLAYHNPRKTYFNFRNNLLLLYKNLPRKSRKRILFRRQLLDGVSALRFLFQGSFGDFMAVWKAHRAYSGMKRVYKGTGEKNFLAENDVIVRGIYQRSIVADFFLRGKKTYGELNWMESR